MILPRLMLLSGFLLSAILACEPTKKKTAAKDQTRDSTEHSSKQTDTTPKPELQDKVALTYWADTQRAQGVGVSQGIGGYWGQTPGGTWGYVAADSTLRIPPRYQYPKKFVDSIAVCQLHQALQNNEGLPHYHYWHAAGRVIHKADSVKFAGEFRPARAVLVQEKGRTNRYRMAGLNGSLPISREFKKMKPFCNGIALAQGKRGNWGYFSRDLQAIEILEMKENESDPVEDDPFQLFRQRPPTPTGRGQETVALLPKMADPNPLIWFNTDEEQWDPYAKFVPSKLHRYHIEQIKPAGREGLLQGWEMDMDVALLKLEPRRQGRMVQKGQMRPDPPKVEVVMDFRHLQDLKPFSNGRAMALKEHPVYYFNSEAPKNNPMYIEKPYYEDGDELAQQLPKIGYLNPEGEWALKPAPLIAATSFSEGKAALLGRNGWEFIDVGGHQAVPGTYQEPGFLHKPVGPTFYEFRPGKGQYPVPKFKKGRAVVVKDSAFGIIDDKGQWVRKPDPNQKMGSRSSFDQIYSYHDSLARIEERYVARSEQEERIPYWSSRRVGFLNRSGKVAIERQFDRVRDFQEGRAAVFQEGKGWGFIDKRGQVVVPLKYDKVRDFRAGRAAAVLLEEGPENDNPGWGFVDRQGQVVIPLRYDKVMDYTGGTATIRTKEGRYTINRQGQKIEYKQK